MNLDVIKLTACLAWAGVAVSSATPANALAVTMQYGAYATCSSSITYTTIGTKYCPEVYTAAAQNIKFLSQACNTGGCIGSSNCYVDFIYNPGRTTTELQETFCGTGGSWRVWALSSCSC
jgi:hypothetical protein